MEKRVYNLDNLGQLIKVRKYLERFYVSKGKGIVIAHSGNFDFYHINIDFKEFLGQPEAVSVFLDFFNKKLITTGSSRANGTIRTEIEEGALEEILKTERITKEEEILKNISFINMQKRVI